MRINEIKEVAYELQQKIDNTVNTMDKAIEQGNCKQQMESAKTILELSDDFTDLVDYSPHAMAMDLGDVYEKQKEGLSNSTESIKKLMIVTKQLTNIFVNFSGKEINKEFTNNIESAKSHFQRASIK